MPRFMDTLNEVMAITQTLVVSRDPAALKVARRHGASTFGETGKQDLNLALTRASHIAVAQKANCVLIGFGFLVWYQWERRENDDPYHWSCIMCSVVLVFAIISGVIVGLRGYRYDMFEINCKNYGRVYQVNLDRARYQRGTIFREYVDPRYETFTFGEGE